MFSVLSCVAVCPTALVVIIVVDVLGIIAVTGISAVAAVYSAVEVPSDSRDNQLSISAPYRAPLLLKKLWNTSKCFGFVSKVWIKKKRTAFAKKFLEHITMFWF
jgi:hypothetical protein